METQNPRLKKTMHIGSIIEESSASWNEELRDPKMIMSCFARWPIYEVRTACLEAMRPMFFKLEHLAWAREAVNDLVIIGDNEMALEIVKLYTDTIFSKARNSLSRGLSFSRDVPHYLLHYVKYENGTNMWEEFRSMLLFIVNFASFPRFQGPVMKTICLSMDPGEFPGCYHHEDLLSIQLLFRARLNRLAEKYDEEAWRLAERILHIVLKVGDREYINQLTTIITAHERGETGPASENTFSRVANIAILKEALRILKQSPKKPAQQPA